MAAFKFESGNQMATLLVFALTALFWMRLKRRGRKIAGAVLLVVLYSAACGLYNSNIERWARSTESSQTAQASTTPNRLIIVLGLGLDERAGKPLVPTYAIPRLFKALEAYRACEGAGLQCRILVSGGPTGSLQVSEAEVYRDRLLAVEPGLQGHIEVESKSRNTWENAKYSSEWAQANGYQQAELVTSLLHMPRSQQYFAHFGLDTVAAPSEQSLPDPSWLPNGWNLFMVDVFLHELTGFARYRIYEALGWNTR